MLRRIVTSTVLGAVAGSVLAASVLFARADGPTSTVSIDNFSFGPQALTVKAGTTVTWINHDEDAHTVVNAGNPRLFKSSALGTDDKFTFIFDKPGTYQYFCSIHPRMTGTVVVK